MTLALNGRPALIVSECQRGIVDASLGGFAGLAAQVSARGIIPRTSQLARSFRGRSLPVLHLTIVHREDFVDVQPNSLLAAMARRDRRLVAGSPEAEIVPELVPAPEDFVIARSSGLVGFNGTALDAMLRRMGIATVVLAGVSTNVAVAGCALVATDLGYQVIVAEDCVAAADAVTHEVIVREQLRMVARIASADAVEAALPPARAY